MLQVFSLLSIAAGRPGTPQCFLLTPKLLNDLPFSPEVKVLSIVNGPHLQNVQRPFSRVGSPAWVKSVQVPGLSLVLVLKATVGQGNRGKEHFLPHAWTGK